MEVVLYSDKETDIALDEIVRYLNSVCSYLKFRMGESFPQVDTIPMNRPATHMHILRMIKKPTKDCFRTFFFTDQPYDNDFFLNTAENLTIISFSAWEYLTKLPRNNGVLYFIAGTIALNVDNSYRHDENTGCIYDYLTKKKSGWISECDLHSSAQRALLE